ncbi:MAG: hypothetical protein CMH56_11680 [Myxococcales bacterium]|nr:hypothetical protein [Myxococcales bacterium]
MQTAIAGIILLGVLVFIHELGHFLVAKLCGVRVLTFSLGFGPKILGFQLGETEYKISILPLGGFVQMFGENPDEELSEEEKTRSFMHQVLWKKAAIAAAGPIFNFILPVFVFWTMLGGVQERIQPVIGTVFHGGPAQVAQLKTGDRVLAVNGQPIKTFSEMVEQVSALPDEEVRFKIQRDAETLDVTVKTLAVPSTNPLEKDKKVGRIGIGAGKQKAKVAIGPQSIAAMAGLQTGDEILKWDNQAVSSIQHLYALLDTDKNQAHQLEIQRKEEKRTLILPPIGATEPPSSEDTALANPDPILPTPEVKRFAVTAEEIKTATTAHTQTMSAARQLLARQKERGGIAFYEGVLADVKKGTPADKMGLQKGDRFLAYNQKPLNAWATFHQELTSKPDEVHRIAVLRGETIFLTTFRMAPYQDPEMRGMPEKKVLGHVAASAVHSPETFVRDIPWLEAFPQAIDETVKITVLTLKGLWALVNLEMPLDTLGGPIMIFDLAGKAAEQGKGMFLFLLCLISVNLGILNLLPIPVLDGGHLLMFGIEAIQRKPINLATRALATRIGLFLLLALMVTAIGNDILRYFG